MLTIPERYELKYLIPEDRLDLVRRAIKPFCVLDPHSTCATNNQYRISSLYLDTPTRELYRHCCEGRARRWKARIRWYEGGSHVFLEVKRKQGELVSKGRSRLPYHDWSLRLFGPPARDAPAAERDFRERIERHHLAPLLMVRYAREAWMSTLDTYARVTFDRRIVCQSATGWTLATDEQGWLATDDTRSTRGVPRAVVVELKCAVAVPGWLIGVLRTLGLARARYSKYCRGIDRLWENDALSTHLALEARP